MKTKEIPVLRQIQSLNATIDFCDYILTSCAVNFLMDDFPYETVEVVSDGRSFRLSRPEDATVKPKTPREDA